MVASRRKMRGAAQTERGDVFSQQRAGVGAFVDEQRECGAARQSFDAKCAGAGKEIEHARLRYRIAISVHEDIEQGFAQPVGGRPDRGRFRARQRASAQAAADDAHQRRSLRLSGARRNRGRAHDGGRIGRAFAGFARFRLIGCGSWLRRLSETLDRDARPLRSVSTPSALSPLGFSGRSSPSRRAPWNLRRSFFAGRSCSWARQE